MIPLLLKSKFYNMESYFLPNSLPVILALLNCILDLQLKFCHTRMLRILRGNILKRSEFVFQ